MTWQTTASALIRAIAPDDTDGLPLYLLDAEDAREFDDRLCGPSHCLGWTAPSADLMLYRHLSSVGEWEGRGFATVIHTSTIKSLPNILGIVLHEFSHGLDSVLPTSREVTPEDRPYTQPQMLTLAEHFEQEEAAKTRPHWHNHSERFVRASAHLAFRASRLIESVRPSHLAFASNYHPMPFNSEAVWMRSLAQELRHRRREPIREIIDSEPPETFTERWTQATAWFAG